MSWVAQTTITGDDTGWIHVISRIEASSESEAMSGAKTVMITMAGGREAVIRDRPRTSTSMDFVTRQSSYHGYVRFSFLNKSGDWTYSKTEEIHRAELWPA